MEANLEQRAKKYERLRDKVENSAVSKNTVPSRRTLKRQELTSQITVEANTDLGWVCMGQNVRGTVISRAAEAPFTRCEPSSAAEHQK